MSDDKFLNEEGVAFIHDVYGQKYQGFCTQSKCKRKHYCEIYLSAEYREQLEGLGEIKCKPDGWRCRYYRE
jgi:hypothetical protein